MSSETEKKDFDDSSSDGENTCNSSSDGENSDDSSSDGEKVKVLTRAQHKKYFTSSGKNQWCPDTLHDVRMPAMWRCSDCLRHFLWSDDGQEKSLDDDCEFHHRRPPLSFQIFRMLMDALFDGHSGSPFLQRLMAYLESGGKSQSELKERPECMTNLTVKRVLELEKLNLPYNCTWEPALQMDLELGLVSTLFVSDERKEDHVCFQNEIWVRLELFNGKHHCRRCGPLSRKTAILVVNSLISFLFHMEKRTKRLY